jgi:hypothetical protein
LQRILDLHFLHCNVALAKLADPKDLERTFKVMDSSAQHDWRQGFLERRQNFDTSLPANSLGPTDRAMLRQIEAMADNSAAAANVTPCLPDG